MFRLLLTTTFLIGAQVATADTAHCDALYERLKSSTTSDPDSCIPVLEEPRPFEQCITPHDYNETRETSRLVMILDASGSMAGKVGGKSKMSVAKSAAFSFLNDVASDVPVGLVVYGHKGNNKESGKAESCAGIEWSRKIAKGKSGLKKAVGDLSPTGWTPMADALSFVEAELLSRPTKGEGDTETPIVYLVSDGKETCGGDPVAAARSLAASGVKAKVNVIGFDVDSETRAQLEAISEAGSGEFYPAKDAKELNKHLNAAKDAERSKWLFKKCIAENQNKAIIPYRKASLLLPGCAKKETEGKFRDVIWKQLKALTDPADLACASDLKIKAYNEGLDASKPLLDLYNEYTKLGNEALEAARITSIENALPAKK